MVENILQVNITAEFVLVASLYDYTRKNEQVVKDWQTSCCDKSGTSYYHLVTRLMTVTELD
jgi:hypothetical protein